MSRIMLALACFLLLIGNVVAQNPDPKLQAASRLIGQANYAAAEQSLEKIVEAEPQNYRGWYLLGYAQHLQGKYEPAVEAFEAAKKSPQQIPGISYNLACSFAKLGKSSDAIREIELAFSTGYNNVDQLANDADFEAIRSEPEFVGMLKKLRENEKLFVEEARVIHRWLGEAAGDEFGWIARLVGDVDGDGVLDFVTTAPSHQSGNGKIYVYSGKSAELLFAHVGTQQERLGNGASSAGDVNQDSVPDVLVGAPDGPNGGAAYIYSGAGGALIKKLSAPKGGGKFGYKTCGLGDIDGDSHDDVLVTAMTANGDEQSSGACFAFSGQTGKLLFQINGEKRGDKFGSAVACSNRDGKILLAVGAQDAGINQGGLVYVFEIEQGVAKYKFVIQGDGKSVNLGQMFLSFPGDIDQDGTMDIYASDFSDGTTAPGAGKIVVCSGVDGKQLYSIEGTQPGEGFGTSPSDAGDVNGDGIGDLIIGAWQNRTGARSGGRCSLHDGATGKEIDSWTCTQADDTFGFDAVGIGDVDGDGHVDFLLTSAWASIRGPKTGRVFVIAGENYSD